MTSMLSACGSESATQASDACTGVFEQPECVSPSKEYRPGEMRVQVTLKQGIMQKGDDAYTARITEGSPLVGKTPQLLGWDWYRLPVGKFIDIIVKPELGRSPGQEQRYLVTGIHHPAKDGDKILRLYSGEIISSTKAGYILTGVTSADGGRINIEMIPDNTKGEWSDLIPKRSLGFLGYEIPHSKTGPKKVMAIHRIQPQL